MIKHLPEWIIKRYAKLWFKLKNKEFTKEQAEKVLGTDNAMAVFLSDLRKAGWMEIKMSQEDARKTIYKLKEPTSTFLNFLKELSKEK
jgi:DNA-binding MarR family transcriptional regulator